MEDLNDILKLSGMKAKVSEAEVEEAYTNEPNEKYTPVDAILRQGTDLNRPKTQHAVAGFTGDNPMTEGGADVDEDAVRELKIYIDHNADLYSQNVEPIQRNLSRKWDKGIYDHELAQKLFYYLAVNGAKQYGQEHSNGDGLRIFSPDVRRAVAKELADDWLAELKAGNKMEEAEEDLEAMLADILIREDEPQFYGPGDREAAKKVWDKTPAATVSRVATGALEKGKEIFDTGVGAVKGLFTNEPKTDFKPVSLTNKTTGVKTTFEEK